MRQNDKTATSLGQALGANRVIPLPGLSSGGPLDLLQLRAEVATRLQSSGGRPTDPSWTVQRLVPFGEDRWKQLEKLAENLSHGGRHVSPGQLAAILIERTLNQIVEGDVHP